jgi:hypothetical protein
MLKVDQEFHLELEIDDNVLYQPFLKHKVNPINPTHQ